MTGSNRRNGDARLSCHMMTLTVMFAAIGGGMLCWRALTGAGLPVAAAAASVLTAAVCAVASAITAPDKSHDHEGHERGDR